MNIKDLHYLLAVADHRHFRKAAEACFVSQPTLSGQLKKLEEQLGVVLIDRSTRQASLTPAGERIVAQARQVVAAYRQIEVIARSCDDPLSGPVSLGLIPTVAPYLLPRLLPGLVEAFPRLALTLVEDKTRVLLQMLDRGTLDMAIMADLPELDGYQHYQLYQEPFRLAVNQQHPLGAKASVSLKQLQGETLLMLADGHCFRDQALDVCFAAGAREDDSYQATSLETLGYMIAANSGMTMMPLLACVERPGVRYLGLREGPCRDVVLITRRNYPRGELAGALAGWIRGLRLVSMAREGGTGAPPR